MDLTALLTMKNIREILRQKWALQRSHRNVAASLDVSAGVVGKVVGKAIEAGLTWDAVQALSDEELERVIYDGEPASRARPLPDFTHIHAQRRRKGVTLALLHVGYPSDVVRRDRPPPRLYKGSRRIDDLEEERRLGHARRGRDAAQNTAPWELLVAAAPQHGMGRTPGGRRDPAGLSDCDGEGHREADPGAR